VRPFDFIILLFSFAYTLALTHLLSAITRMIRHRRSLVVSWPHAIWMLDALIFLAANWISLWDFHEQTVISIGAIAIGFAFVVVQYLICALVTPDFEGSDAFNLRTFHERQRKTYIGAFLVCMLLSLALNSGGGAIGIQNWANENALVWAMVPPTAIPLFVKNNYVEIAAPLLLLVLGVTYTMIYYPALR